VVATTTAGRRIVCTIKPERRLASGRFLAEMQTIAWWVRKKAFADDVRLLNDADVDPVACTTLGSAARRGRISSATPISGSASDSTSIAASGSTRSSPDGSARDSAPPACLTTGSPSRGRRVGRVAGLFAPVRTCPVQGIALWRSVASAYSERFQDMELVATEDRTLRAMATQAVRRPVSALQAHVERRREGVTGPTLLGGQAIDQASRAREVLGAVLIHGPRVDLPALSESQWDAAGAEGCAFASRGEAGLREAKVVGLANAGMADLVAAAMISRWPVIDIVRPVLDGGLSRVEVLVAE
jgi:hypothetical protein